MFIDTENKKIYILKIIQEIIKDLMKKSLMKIKRG